MRNTRLIDTVLIVATAVLASCRRPEPVPVRLYQSALVGCGQDASIDGAPDAPPDAPPDAFVDIYASSWAKHVIFPGATTGVYRGADGVDTATIGGQLAIAAPWEQGGAVTVSLPAQTITIATGMFGAEDAKFGDFDGDGRIDVAIARDADARIHISFQPAVITDPWPSILLTSSQTPYHGRWLQLAAVDVDGDGLLDIVGGSRVGTNVNPAQVAWFKNPGPSSRTGSAWTFHSISIAGWIMSVVPRDVDNDGDPDLVVSDRQYYFNADNVRQYGLMGARWLENVNHGASWVNHTIATPAPNSSAFGFLDVVDVDGDGVEDVVTGQGADGAVNVVTIRKNLGNWFGLWDSETLPATTNVGALQGVKVADVDGDGRKDVVISTTEQGGVCCNNPLEGVYWMQSIAPSSWAQRPMAGPAGTKWDNVIMRDMDGDGDLDALLDEQTDQIGLEWMENPRH